MRATKALILFVLYMVLPAVLHAQDWEDRRVFGAAEPTQTLRVLSSTDTSLFEPIIDSFLADTPNVAIEYLVTGTADIDRIFRASPAAFDVVISSAMDLQFKMVNDGLARELMEVSNPDWAKWRQSLFAFTSEPATIVINKRAFAGRPIPKTRQDLIEAMRERPEVFRGRVGTYDVRQSGLGYLFATQDARASETFWRLMEVMGALEVRLYCCSGAMIDDLSDGTIAIAYNVLGSYAAARTDSENSIEIIMPSDFPTTMMRTAMVSRTTQLPELATGFVRHLVDVQSRQNTANYPLPALNVDRDGADPSTIVLEPALMTFLDRLKRRRFLAEWENALIQSVAR